MIFISYRRDDTTEVVTYIYNQLIARFGSELVFVDFNDIIAGEKWPDTLRKKLTESRLLLAVVGKKWGDARFDANYADRSKRHRLRLDDPDDWVRVEICTAMQRQALGQMKVVVVMIDDAVLPDTAWNCELDQLPDIQQTRIRHQRDFSRDFNDLCEQLEAQLPDIRRGAKRCFAGVGTEQPAAAHGQVDVEQTLRNYVSNEVRAHSRLQLPLVAENGQPIVTAIDELRIDLPLVVSHEHETLDPQATLLWLGQDVQFIYDAFRATHMNALLVDRASRHEDIRREYGVMDRLRPGTLMVIVGDPGCGKSTLLQWICHHYATRQQPRRPTPSLDTNAAVLPNHDWLPLLVLCRDFSGQSPPSSLSELLRNHFEKRQYDHESIVILISEYERRLRRGQAILLIDGLDEIPNSEDRIRFSKLLASIVAQCPDSPMIVTSRVVGFQAVREELAADFDHMVVGPLDRVARRTFLERWSKLIGWDDSKTATLIQQVCHSRVLTKLAENIFMLAMVAQVHLIEDNLPSRRVDVYRRALQWMIQRRRPLSGPALTTNELLPHMEFLAYSMRKAGQQRWNEVDVLAAFREIRRMEPNEPVLQIRTPEQLLQICIESVGLLNVAGTEPDHKGFDRRMIQFFHQSFQEYFAGTAINHGHDSAEQAGPVAKLRDLLATIEICDREVRIWGHYTIVEPVIADYWQDAVRMAIAEMQPLEADEAILMLLPTPTTLAAEARARAVFALQCLADEPQVSEHAATAVFTAVLENLRDGDGINAVRNTWMDEAQAAVCESAFGSKLTERLLWGFIHSFGEDRSRIAGPLVACLGDHDAKISSENIDETLDNLRCGLDSNEQAVRIQATLRFLNDCYLTGGKLGFLTLAQQSLAMEILLSALEQDAVTVHCALWALTWLTGAWVRFSGPGLDKSSPVALLEEFVVLPPAAARRIEAALRRFDLDPGTIRYGCLALTRERGVDLIVHQIDWIYELAVLADGGRPRRELPAPRATNAQADVAWMQTLLTRDMPLRFAAEISLALGSLGVFTPEMIAPLKHQFLTKSSDVDKRDEAMIYLGLMGAPGISSLLIEAADTAPQGDDDYLYSRGLFGLLLLDNVDVLASQIRKALPSADLNSYAFGLAGSRDPRGLELLATFRNHDNVQIRTAATKAYALGWMKSN